MDEGLICGPFQTSFCKEGKRMVADSLPTVGDKATFVPFHIYCNIEAKAACPLQAISHVLEKSRVDLA